MVNDKTDILYSLVVWRVKFFEASYFHLKKFTMSFAVKGKKGKIILMASIEKAFEIVNKKFEAALGSQGFASQKVASTDSNELVTLYTGEALAYSVIYYKDKKHMVLRSCDMTENGPDNEWKTIATWMFDPVTDTEKEAESIANDFIDNVSAPVFKQVPRQKKKKKKDSDDGNGDPVFFSKRLIAVFPELRDEIREEQDSYEEFRAVTFTREHILPKVKALMESGTDKEIDKLSEILSAQYSYGDIDTRPLITIIILNSIVDSDKKEAIRRNMSDDLKKAWAAAEKYRGKKVKPAKQKKPSLMQKLMSDSIENQKALKEGRF